MTTDRPGHPRWRGVHRPDGGLQRPRLQRRVLVAGRDAAVAVAVPLPAQVTTATTATAVTTAAVVPGAGDGTDPGPGLRPEHFGTSAEDLGEAVRRSPPRRGLGWISAVADARRPRPQIRALGDRARRPRGRRRRSAAAPADVEPRPPRRPRGGRPARPRAAAAGRRAGRLRSRSGRPPGALPATAACRSPRPPSSSSTRRPRPRSRTPRASSTRPSARGTTRSIPGSGDRAILRGRREGIPHPPPQGPTFSGPKRLMSIGSSGVSRTLRRARAKPSRTASR